MSQKKHHHGGAWKVAYADFVTAMMALFLVLWLSSQDQHIKEAVERSFKNPFASITKESTGVIPNKDTQAVKSSQGNFDSASAVELNMLRKLSDDLVKALTQSDDSQQDPGKLELLSDGVRISIYDRAKRPIFQEDTAEFTEYGKWVFSTLAWQIARYTNSFRVELEGHTERGHHSKVQTTDNWDLSADRANRARRKLLEHGVTESQIRKVAGFADTMPLPDSSPTDEINRRVAVRLKVKDEKGEQ